jgi:hypothetical protein
MRSPKPYKVDVRQGPKCSVIERPTGLVIAENACPRTAKRIANFLNGGNGFNGRTPRFFLNRWELS